jgi:hypothetical protein
MRPVLLAAGLGLCWFVEYQDAGGGVTDMVMWSYLVVTGTRLLADFVGAWVVVSALQLIMALARYGMTYLRTTLAQGSG